VSRPEGKPTTVRPCMAWQDGAKCNQIGHGVGYGLRLCDEHEGKLLAYLLRRARDAEAHRVAEAACGEATPPQLVIPGRGETSGGLPTLGKRR
jgi:hypothetical protein